MVEAALFPQLKGRFFPGEILHSLKTQNSKHKLDSPIIIGQRLIVGLGVPARGTGVRGMMSPDHVPAVAAVPLKGVGTLEEGAVFDMLQQGPVALLMEFLRENPHAKLRRVGIRLTNLTYGKKQRTLLDF